MGTEDAEAARGQGPAHTRTVAVQCQRGRDREAAWYQPDSRLSNIGERKMNDHYSELVISCIHRFGKSYGDQLELELVNESVKRGYFKLVNVPADIKTSKWRAFKRLPSSDLVWTSDDYCPACEGEGELSCYGRNGYSYSVECPECNGDSTPSDPTEIVTDDVGNFLRIRIS